MNLKKDVDQYVLEAQVTIDQKHFNTQFAIDNKTARGFNDIFGKKPCKEKYDAHYIYEYAGYSVNQSEHEYAHYIEIRLNKKRFKEKIPCSKLFCQNLRWLSECERDTELSEIEV